MKRDRRPGSREQEEMGDGDLTRDMGSIRRESLVNSLGLKYKDFRSGLTPRYHLVWTHLLSGYGALGLISAAIAGVEVRWPGFFPWIILVGSISYGYTLAYLQLFIHEAAHYNLAKDRKANDRLANLFIATLFGQDINAYRLVHFGHHRHLGTPLDTEPTYFDPLNLRFIAESFTGIRAFKAFFRRDSFVRSQQGEGVQGDSPRRSPSARLILSLTLHACAVMGAFGLGLWALGISWVLGMGVFFPFFIGLRQLLEHRDEFAKGDVDYHRTPHGAVNRMFGSGPLASTFGGAGFNRHLLHHWEPQLSYTRLKELEAYLIDQYCRQF